MSFEFNFKPPQKLLYFAASQKAVKLIGLMFLLIGLPVMIFAIKIHIDEKRALSWTPHTAQILRANIRTHIDDENNKETYSLDVTYQYKWKNILYKGNQYRLYDMSGSSFAETNKILQELLEASKQKVDYPIFVNPNKPNVSAIKNSVNTEAKLAFTIFGFVFPLVGFFMFCFPHLFNRRLPQSTSAPRSK